MNPHPQLEGFLNWLFNRSLQAGALVLLVPALQWIFRRTLTARWRFALWWVVLVRLLLPFNPQSAVSLFNFFKPHLQIEGTNYATPAKQVKPPAKTFVRKDFPPAIPAEQNQSVIQPIAAAQTSLEPISVAPAVAIAVSKHSLSFDDFVVPEVAGLWLGGVLLFIGLITAQLTRFYRKLSRDAVPASSDLQTLLDNCRREFGVSRPVELLKTDAVQSPALFGLLRLRLLVPRGFGASFAARELRYIFLHELAHVKRGDLWLNWLVTALQIAHWFNPLLWLGFARLRADRELACDELTLLRAGDSTGTAYGETVVKLLENLNRPSAIPGLVGILEDKKQMRRRISMIANFRRPGRWSALAVVLIVAVAAAVLTDAQTEKSAANQNSIARPDLTGVVAAKNGERLPMPANVFIATAAPKTGTSTFCPSCYADCVKHSRTDTQGNFKIESLDPRLTFQILAVAKGYQPKSISKVDPTKGPLKIELAPIVAADAAPDHSLRGRVVDTKGKPIEGAVVEMRGIETKDGGGSWGELPGIDPLAVTDENGEFLITSKNPFDMMDVKISARAFADKNFSKLPSGKENKLVMTDGATIHGRVLFNGRPLKGVSVGISGVERQAGVYVGHFEVGTDADGRFAFVNIPPDVDFWIYTGMNSMKKFGAAPIQEIHSGKDGETTDVGDLIAAPAYRLAGRVVLADGSPLPAKVRLLISREDAWDSMEIILDTNGNFDTTGVPDELISLSARVKGYHVSARNLSVDELNSFQLIGRVDRDITNLIFVLEKGPQPQPDYNHVDPEYNEIRGRTLHGAEGVVEHSRDWTISGHAIDADTKQPVPNFRVTPGQVDEFNRAGWDTLRAVDGSNGVYSVYVNKRAPQPMLKAEADGYLPSGIEIQPRDATNVDFILKKGSGPTGMVITSGGKPAATTTLVLLNEEMNQAEFNSGGKLNAYGNKTALRTADANGHFSFKPILGMKCIAAASSNGFAIVSVQSLTTNPIITLKPYGKIIGTLKRTSGPGTNETLDATLAERPDGLNMWLPADTDEQGRFNFDHVPAGHLQISYRVPMGGNGWQDRPLKEVDLKPGQTLEINIETGNRPPPDTNSFRPPPPPKRIPGEEIKGIVLLPNGQPAADAEVALQIPNGPYFFQIGRGEFSSDSGLRDNGLLVNAGADGSFTLPMFENAASVVAINEEGFAQVSLDELKKSPQIQLQKFGRVAGTLRVGHHPGTNETVDLSSAVRHNHFSDLTNSIPKFLQPPQYDSQTFSARTDGNGKFAIGFVPPGEQSLWRRIPYGERGWTQSQLATVDVKPGETIVTNVGGGGRTVTGKVRFNGNFPVNFTEGAGIIETPTFEFFEKLRQLKTDAERKAFLASPEAKALRSDLHSFSLRVAADGSFRAEDVLPGNYEFVFQPTVKLDEKSRVWTMLASAHEFTVPPAKNENDDSTVELGTIDLKKRELSALGPNAKKK